jgi:hypothetical protein
LQIFVAFFFKKKKCLELDQASTQSFGVIGKTMFAWAYQSKSVSHGTVFFSHNESASAKNTASRVRLDLPD